MSDKELEDKGVTPQNTENKVDSAPENIEKNEQASDPLKHEAKQNDFMRRLANVRTTRWIRFAVVSLLFLMAVIWVGSPWLLLVWLLLFDIYITGYIPFTFWKNSKSKLVRTIMSWVDAIVYALVLVYLIFIFIGQNYKIPSSSLEKSLLVGDYLWVNKMIYGPRMPQTPLHFPLAQHTLPVLNTPSYIENPQLSYRRLQGMRDIKRGDIVVFNYPQGDTVALKVQNPDYYQIVVDLERQGIDDARSYIRNNPEMFGEVVWRPVDRRENYVKRTIGLPGERISIKDDVIYINGKKIDNPENVQFNYIVPVKTSIPEDTWHEIGVRSEDHGVGPQQDAQTGKLFYDVPLTAKAKAAVEALPQVSGKLIPEKEFYNLKGDPAVFPMRDPYGWTRSDMGEIWIPKKGVTLHLTQKNLPIYRRVIETYEDNKLEVKNGKIYINGRQSDYYTFKMNYYWMMGDNRDRSADSRYWGFVPEDHVVGTPMFVIISFDEERSIFSGSIRWNRMFKTDF